MRRMIVAAAMLLALGVGLGAFGAHALRMRLDPAMLAVWQTGVQYHLVHAMGALVVAMLALTQPEMRLLCAACALLLLGVLLFSGSLYVLALSGARWLGVITPLGGVAFIAGWLTLAIAALRLPAQPAGGS